MSRARHMMMMQVRAIHEYESWDDSSEDEEEEDDQGSSPRAFFGRSANLNRDRQAGHQLLLKDYFADNPVYGQDLFHRRFRMTRALFLKIQAAIEIHDPYFQQRPDALGVLGFTATQKCAAAIKLLAYGVAANMLDNYLRMSESTALECLKRFCKGVLHLYKDFYLREATLQDQDRLMAINSRRGFPGMLGSLDCMHWAWKNCPKALSGHYSGKEGCPTIVLQAVADRELWIWHANFGMPGANNDLTVLAHSDFLAPRPQNQLRPFTIAGHHYDRGYYLVDGIYPKYPTLISTVRNPVSDESRHFAKQQEGARKDIERAFGRLQAKWHIITRPARLWFHADMRDVMETCIVLHNMTIEDERDLSEPYNNDLIIPAPDVVIGEQALLTLEQWAASIGATQDQTIHDQLFADLHAHQWSLR